LRASWKFKIAPTVPLQFHRKYFKIFLAFLSKLFILVLPFRKTIAIAHFSQDDGEGAKNRTVSILWLRQICVAFSIASILAGFSNP